MLGRVICIGLVLMIFLLWVMFYRVRLILFFRCLVKCVFMGWIWVRLFIMCFWMFWLRSDVSMLWRLCWGKFGWGGTRIWLYKFLWWRVCVSRISWMRLRSIYVSWWVVSRLFLGMYWVFWWMFFVRGICFCVLVG